MTHDTLIPKTDAERLLVEQLGKDGGIRPEFARELLEQIGETHKEALAASEVPKEESATRTIDADRKVFVDRLIRGEVGGFAYKQFIEFAKDLKNGLYVPERGDIAMPMEEEFEKMLTEMFLQNPKGLETVRQMERAMPFLSADLAWPIYLAMLNNNKKRRNQVDAYDGRAGAFAQQDRILNLDPNGPKVTKLTPGVMESVPKLPFRSGLLRNIATDTQRELTEGGAKAPTGKEYALMQSLAPDLVDLSGWSMLREESTGNIIGQDGLVSGGSSCDWCGESGVKFRGGSPEVGCYGAVSRPVVML